MELESSKISDFLKKVFSNPKRVLAYKLVFFTIFIFINIKFNAFSNTRQA